MNASPEKSRLNIAQLGFLAILSTAGVGLLAWAAHRHFAKTEPIVPPGPDIAKEAKDYLRGRDFKPLSDPLAKILDEAKPTPTHPHPLLGEPAIDFQLNDHQDKPVRLKSHLDEGPVVLVFYYGYHCNHCVGQLFALHDDIALFRELGARVIAVSADKPDLTRQRFKQFGAFAFPVLSDPGNEVALKYGAFVPAKDGKAEDLRHATFLIDRLGIVRWANLGDEPFTDHRALLREIAGGK